MSIKKVLVYEEYKGWMEVSPNSLDYKWPYSPEGMAKWTPRKNSETYHYVYIGSVEMIVGNHNEYWVKKIMVLQDEINNLRKRMIRPPTE